MTNPTLTVFPLNPTAPPGPPPAFPTLGTPFPQPVPLHDAEDLLPYGEPRAGLESHVWSLPERGTELRPAVQVSVAAAGPRPTEWTA